MVGQGRLVCVRWSSVQHRGAWSPPRPCVGCRGALLPLSLSPRPWQCLINGSITAAEGTEVRHAEELLEGGTVMEVEEVDSS